MEISRQLQWQRKQIQAGRCTICGQKACKGLTFCPAHLQYKRDYYHRIVKVKKTGTILLTGS